MQHPLARDALELARLKQVRRALGPATYACYQDLWFDHRKQTPGDVVTTLEQLGDAAGKSRGAASEWIARLEAAGLVDVYAKKPLRLYVHAPEALDRLRAAKPPSESSDPPSTLQLHPAGARAVAASGPTSDNAHQVGHVGFPPAHDVGFPALEPNIPPLTFHLPSAQATKPLTLPPFDQRANGKGEREHVGFAENPTRNPTSEPAQLSYASVLDRDPVAEHAKLERLTRKWLGLLDCPNMLAETMERYAHAALYEGLPVREVESLLNWIAKQRRSQGLSFAPSAIFNKRMRPKLAAHNIPWTIQP
jgi:hypothetical protein